MPTAGGWVGVAAALFASVLIDLEFGKKKRFSITFEGYEWMVSLESAPELLHRVLFAGEEQPLEGFPLEADNQAGSQDGEEGHQDAHGQVPAVCSRAHMGTGTATSVNEFFRGG